MAKLRWISIDPGFKRLGITYWLNQSPVSSELLEFRDRGNKESFIDYRNEGLLSYLNRFRLDIIPNCDILVFETMPLNNMNTQRSLVSMVIATFLSIAWMNNVQVYEIAARKVKKGLMDDASATKHRIRRAVLELYPELGRNRKLGDISFDEMDSVAIGEIWKRENPDIFC